MFDSLQKYATSIGIHLDLQSVPIQINLLLFFIDRLLHFHDKHIEIRKRVNSYIGTINLSDGVLQEDFEKELEDVIPEQVWVNNHIQSFFSLLMVEIAKDLELNENSVYKKIIDERILIKPYRRLQYGKGRNVGTMSELIIHFRDAIAHNQIGCISDSARLKEAVDVSSTTHLVFLVDDKTREKWCFMIGDGLLEYGQVELLIQIILTEGFSKFPYALTK